MIDKLYKYWIFYKDNEIYAYTDSKEYAKRFMEERNMKLFQKKKVKIQVNIYPTKSHFLQKKK